LEFSHLDGQCFQIFLDNLAAEYREHLNVVQLDNGKFHHSSQLKIPDNILLVFQPPYSPELNLGESMAIYKTRIELGTV
jgi:transposase